MPATCAGIRLDPQEFVPQRCRARIFHHCSRTIPHSGSWTTNHELERSQQTRSNDI